MSLCQSLLDIMEQQAVEQDYRRVKRVILEIGSLAGVETEALRFGFDVVMRDSLAEGAQLEILERPAMAWCFDCSASVQIAARGEPCPRCQGYKLQCDGGDEMRILELEVE